MSVIWEVPVLLSRPVGFGKRSRCRACTQEVGLYPQGFEVLGERRGRLFFAGGVAVSSAGLVASSLP